VSIHFSYLSTDTDPIIAYWFSSLGGDDDDNGSCLRCERPPIKIARNCDYNPNGDDNGGKEKKKNHSWTTTATKKTKKTADCKVCFKQDGGGNVNKGMRAEKKCLPPGKGGACFGRIRQPKNTGNNYGSEKDLLYNPIYELLNVDVRMPRKERKKKNIWTSTLNRFGHKLLKYSEKRPREEKDTASALNCSRRGAVRVGRRKRRRCYLVLPPSAVVTTTNDDNRRNCNGTSGRLLTTQESLSLKAAATECGREKKKKKKKKVDFVLTMEQQRSSGTHFPRKRPHSL
jgi:hypothetical protein